MLNAIRRNIEWTMISLLLVATLVANSPLMYTNLGLIMFTGLFAACGLLIVLHDEDERKQAERRLK